MKKEDDSGSSVRHTMEVVREAIATDSAALNAANKNSVNRHVVMNWIQIGLVVGSMLVTVVSTSAIMWYQLDRVQSTVDRTEGLVSSLKDRVLSLEKDDEHDGVEFTRLQEATTQLAYKMQNQEKYVSRLKSQMELLWVAGGFPEMKGGD